MDHSSGKQEINAVNTDATVNAAIDVATNVTINATADLTAANANITNVRLDNDNVVEITYKYPIIAQYKKEH